MPRKNGHDDADVADDDDGVPPSAHQLRIELEPDQEHEEDQADLAERLERADALRGKDPGEGLGREVAERRRAKKDARRRSHRPPRAGRGA